MTLAGVLRPGDTVLVGTGTGEPLVLIEALVEAASALGPGANITAIQVMTGGTERLAELSGSALRVKTPVPGRKTRKAIGEGRAELLTLPMSGILRGILDGSLRIDGVLIQGRALDARFASPGLIADVMIPGWEKARFRALELNDQIPRIACESALAIGEADVVVHSSRAPNVFAEEAPDAAAARIGEHVASIVPDGATVELGVGRALAGIAPALIVTRRDLAMHTGIVGDTAMRLIEAGCVSRPIRGPACAIGATSMGTPAFYAWADAEPRIAITDSRRAHSSDYLATLGSFVAINTAIQVDLAGNTNLNVHNGRIVSGVGGAGDFAAAGARGAASIVALFATTRDGVSTIVPAVQSISVPAAHVTHVVTEYGIAAIRGVAADEARRRIAAIAAPAHRDLLMR